MWQFIHCSGLNITNSERNMDLSIQILVNQNVFLSDRLFGHFNSIKACIYLLFNLNIYIYIYN